MEIGILPPELKSIEQLFTGDIKYAVPKYQRSFAWGNDEIEELWDDLLAATERKGEYFLGTIVLHRKPNEPSEIIDGQQRLSCITMMFCAIRNIFLSNHDERASHIQQSFLGSKGFSRDATLSPKLVLNQTNNETFIQDILPCKNQEDIEKILRLKKINSSNILLLQAYKYFLVKILEQVGAKGTESDKFLIPLIDTLRSQVKLITITVTSEEDANLFFESLNARGKELAISDLVKNRLFYEAGIQVNRAQQMWEHMENELVSRPTPEYLRHFWIAKKTDDKSPSVREKQLYRMIIDEIRNSQNKTMNLLEDLDHTSTDYARISNPDLWIDNQAYDDDFFSEIDELKLFRVTQCNPILINAFQSFDNPKDIVTTFKIVTNFSFRYFIIGNQSPGNLERISGDIAYGIRSRKYETPKHIADAFRTVNSDPAFKADFSLVSFQKSRSKMARYVLGKINNFQNHQQNGGGEMTVNPNARNITLEHVFPQDQNSSWLSQLSKNNDPKEYIYRLGNLTLLSAKINRDIADESFLQKKQEALDSSNLPINKYFRSISEWGAQQIEERQNYLAKIALEVWKL
jgi:uncharacterized protein with ParB-like and HNH nuclease domain